MNRKCFINKLASCWVLIIIKISTDGGNGNGRIGAFPLSISIGMKFWNGPLPGGFEMSGRWVDAPGDLLAGLAQQCFARVNQTSFGRMIWSEDKWRQEDQWTSNLLWYDDPAMTEQGLMEGQQFS